MSYYILKSPRDKTHLYKVLIDSKTGLIEKYSYSAICDDKYAKISFCREDENYYNNNGIIQIIIDILLKKSKSNLCANCFRKIFVENRDAVDIIQSSLSSEGQNFDNRNKSYEEKYYEILSLINIYFK